VIVLTEAMKRHFVAAGYGADKITVLPPPINLKAIGQKNKEPLDHPWLQAPRTERDIPVILAVGRIALQKNYPLLLEAFKIARDSRPMRLIIVGAGTEKATAETKQLAEDFGIREDIDFAGFSNNPFHYMQQCDLFALSSHWEGFGIVVAEALACGITVASVDCPDGPSEILDGTKYGCLAKPHDPESLAQALLDGLDRPLDPDALMQRAAAYDGPLISEDYRRLIHAMTA
jgi:glycosyltransferase involved in cell wall biosynthesis